MLPAIPYDEIQERARQARPGRAILTAITFVPFLIGWVGRKIWMGMVFLTIAILAGWREAGGELAPDKSPAASGHDPYGRS